MAHELEMIGDNVSMAYFGEVPWHGLGTPLSTDDLYDWQRACNKAALDWQVELAPLVTLDTQIEVQQRAVRR